MLTDTTARKVKPNAKPHKLTDAAALYLEVMPTGAKYWRMQYRHAGKPKRLALGVCPEVTLADARAKRDATCAVIRAQAIADGVRAARRIAPCRMDGVRP